MLALVCAGGIILGAGYNLPEQLTLYAAEQGVNAEVQNAEQVQGDQTDEEITPIADEDNAQRASIGIEELARGKKISQIFPDRNLAKAVAMELNKINEQAIVTQEELECMRSVFQGPAQLFEAITNFEGLQFLTNLESIVIHGARFPNLEPITKLSKLKEISFGYSIINDISPLAHANWPELTHFSISDGGYDLFDLSPLKTAYMPKLEHIYIESSTSHEAKQIVAASKKMTIDNRVKDINGQLLAPTAGYGYSEEGEGVFSYENGKLQWQFKEVPTESPYLGVYWSLEQPLNNGTLHYDLSQEVDVSIGSYPVNFITPDYYWGSMPRGEAKPGALVQAPDDAYEDRGEYGVDFLGWYTAPKGGRKWNFARDRMPKEPLNLYARYRLKKVRVTFDNDGVLHYAEATAHRRIQEPTKPQKPGFVFKGWSMSKYKEYIWDFSRNEAYSDMTLYAVFEPPLKVTYDIDGMLDIQTSAPYKKLTRPADPEKSGYRFKGWFTEREGGKQWNFSEHTISNDDITLYARFEPVFTVTYDVDGVGEQTEVAFDVKLKKPRDPNKSGFIFKGWFTEREGGRRWNFNTDFMPNHDLTLYAQFEQTFTVTYDIDGVEAMELSAAYKKLTRPMNPQKEGYRFKGWFTERVGGRQWNFSRDIMPEQHMTLYAQFTKFKPLQDDLSKPLTTADDEAAIVENEAISPEAEEDEISSTE